MGPLSRPRLPFGSVVTHPREPVSMAALSPDTASCTGLGLKSVERRDEAALVFGQVKGTTEMRMCSREC